MGNYDLSDDDESTMAAGKTIIPNIKKNHAKYFSLLTNEYIQFANYSLYMCILNTLYRESLGVSISNSLLKIHVL